MESFKDYFEIVMENSKPRSYSCLMLDCSGIGNFKEIQDQIDKEDIYDEKGYGLEKEPHITILYGIHEQDPEVVKLALSFEPVEYELAGLSLFENEKYDVLKCSVKSKDLHRMNKQATELLDYTSDYPDYKPHLTIAYLKPGTGKKYTKIKDDIFNKEIETGLFIFSNKDSKKTKWNIDGTSSYVTP